MSLPIILAIVLTAAVLAWGAVYLVVRRQREAALNKMFRSDPIDAEIGRERRPDGHVAPGKVEAALDHLRAQVDDREEALRIHPTDDDRRPRVGARGDA